MLHFLIAVDPSRFFRLFQNLTLLIHVGTVKQGKLERQKEREAKRAAGDVRLPLATASKFVTTLQAMRVTGELTLENASAGCG